MSEIISWMNDNNGFIIGWFYYNVNSDFIVYDKVNICFDIF